MQVTEITYELATTIKLREYEYAKPKLSMTVTIDTEDDYNETLSYIKSKVREELREETLKIIDAFHNV